MTESTESVIGTQKIVDSLSACKGGTTKLKVEIDWLGLFLINSIKGNEKPLREC